MRHTMKWAMPLLFVLGGCSFDQQMISVSPPQLVVHSVLDPNSSIQEVLVELTLTGTVAVNTAMPWNLSIRVRAFSAKKGARCAV